MRADVPGVRVVPLDVTDPASVAAAADLVHREVGPAGLRAVVNNAGVIVQGPLELVPPAELRRQFEVNTFGPAYVVQAFLPLLGDGAAGW
jgi:NAD(P)-dependent dehydrogenase (short-subunit alcohol dehydrogenase family)